MLSLHVEVVGSVLPKTDKVAVAVLVVRPEDGTTVGGLTRRDFKLHVGSLPSAAFGILTVTRAIAGDFVCAVKLRETLTGDTLCDKAHAIVYPGIKFPAPPHEVAVHTKDKSEEEKIGAALHRFHEEDPTFQHRFDSETRETPIVATADYAYLRLRDEGYGDAEIAQWTATAQRLAESARDVFVYFKHEDEGKGAAFGQQMMQLLGQTT